MDTKYLLEKLVNSEDLSSHETVWMMKNIMDGNITSAQVAALLTALRIKGETTAEITACVRVMREKATKISTNYPLLLDTCGTGGDASGSFNISTTVALLLAGGNYMIAKHGNRSMSSQSGSADLLEALGVKIELSPEQVGQCIDQARIGFLFAPALHSAMKNVVPIRKELAIRTIFNVLGPLTNPAGANVQIIGLFSTTLVPKIIKVLKALGSRSAYVFSGLDGMDEISISDNSLVARLNSRGAIEEFIFNPEKYGFKKAPQDEIKGGTPKENAVITRKILNGEMVGACRDIVVLNAGFAISAAEELPLSKGFEKATSLVESGVGIKALDRLIKISNSL